MEWAHFTIKLSRAISYMKMIFIVGISEDPNSLFLIHIQRITHVHWCSTYVNKVESGYVNDTEYAKKLLREFKVMDYKIWHAFLLENTIYQGSLVAD